MVLTKFQVHSSLELSVERSPHEAWGQLNLFISSMSPVWWEHGEELRWSDEVSSTCPNSPTIFKDLDWRFQLIQAEGWKNFSAHSQEKKSELDNINWIENMIKYPTPSATGYHAWDLLIRSELFIYFDFNWLFTRSSMPNFKTIDWIIIIIIRWFIFI
jgi:hypothetical protein